MAHRFCSEVEISHGHWGVSHIFHVEAWEEWCHKGFHAQHTEWGVGVCEKHAEHGVVHPGNLPQLHEFARL